jgi:hypothetical protein
MGECQVILELPEQGHILRRKSKADFCKLFHMPDNNIKKYSRKQNISVDI